MNTDQLPKLTIKKGVRQIKTIQIGIDFLVTQIYL